MHHWFGLAGTDLAQCTSFIVLILDGIEAEYQTLLKSTPTIGRVQELQHAISLLPANWFSVYHTPRGAEVGAVERVEQQAWLGRPGLGEMLCWAGLGWAGLGWAGLGWQELGRAGLTPTTAGTAGQGSAACPVSTADAEAGWSRASPSSYTYRKAPSGVGHALFVLSDDQLTRIFHSANNALCCASQIVCVCVCLCVCVCVLPFCYVNRVCVQPRPSAGLSPKPSCRVVSPTAPVVVRLVCIAEDN